MKKAIVAFLFFAGYALAGDPSVVNDAERAYKEGMELLELALPSDVITPETMEQREAGYVRYGRDRNALFEKAVDCFRRAILLDPHSAKAYNSMGTAFRELGKKAEALQAYAKAGEADITFSWGHKNAGDILLRDKSYGEAISAYKAFMKFNTKYGRAEVLFKLGTIYAILGQRDDALRHFRNAIEVSAPHESWRERAEAEVQQLQTREIRK